MKKKLIIVAILTMSIGFALISTNLIINGTSTIGKTTFDVYFSGAVVDGYDKTNEVVKSNKTIEFTSRDLLFTDDTSELIYEVTNNSSNYDAKVSVSCTNQSNKITVEEVPKNLTVYAKTIETGSIVVTLNEMAVDPEDVVITCTLNVNAEERTSLATDEIVVGTYGITGTLVDNNNQPLSDQYLAIYSEEKKIVQTDSNGFFYVSGLERGIHEIYLINESDKDSSNTVIKSKPKGLTSTNKNETIVLSNNYKIKNVNIDTTTVMYTITFNTLDENISNQTKYISKGTTYGTLPTLEKEHYTFGGWYTSSSLQDDTTKVNSTDIYNLEGNQMLYASWTSLILFQDDFSSNSNWEYSSPSTITSKYLELFNNNDIVSYIKLKNFAISGSISIEYDIIPVILSTNTGTNPTVSLELFDNGNYYLGMDYNHIPTGIRKKFMINAPGKLIYAIDGITLAENNIYHFELTFKNGILEFFIDNNKIYDYNIGIDNYVGKSLGFMIVNSKYRISNFKIKSIQD